MPRPTGALEGEKTSQKRSGEIQASGASAQQGDLVGNAYDLASLMALVIGGMVLFSCGTCGYGLYCLPPVSILLGTVGLLTAKKARNPSRTRTMSLIGIGGGALILLLFLLVITLYIVVLGILIIAGDSSPSQGF